MPNSNKIYELLISRDFSRLEILLILLSTSKNNPIEVKNIKNIAINNGYSEITKWNISDILKRSKGMAVKLKKGWILSSKGKNYLEEMNIVLEDQSLTKKNQTKELRSLCKDVTNEDTVKFIEEAIIAYEYALYRSSIVLMWSGAISIFYDHVIENCLTEFNAEAHKMDIRWKAAKIKDDLGRMKESQFLDIIGRPPLSIIGKNLKENLKNNGLQLRNSCGHPNSFVVGEHITAAFLELLIENVFKKF